MGGVPSGSGDCAVKEDGRTYDRLKSIYAIVLVGALVGMGFAGSGIAQLPLEVDLGVECIVQSSACNSSEDSEVSCGGVAQENETICEREYNTISMEYVQIWYCCESDDEYYETTGSIHHTTRWDGESQTYWYNNYRNGNDLDDNNAANTDGCGYWEDLNAFDDESDHLIGQINADTSDPSQGGCPVGLHGWWETGVDKDGD